MPWSYPRRILLAVTGLSPQVVTETLYALAVKPPAGHVPFVPTEVYVITTRQGAEHARLNLLSDEPGWFHRLLRDYRLTGIAFDAASIHVLSDAREHPLDDIRTPEDNERTADFITARLRELTGDAQAALHVSLAGGRKTMGFYLGYALSLYGREQDRLSHVLVSAPFESHPDFYYPTPYERVIHTKSEPRLAYDCRNAEVTLAEIPFVRMRHDLDDRLRKGGASFSETVAAAQRALGPAELTLDLSARKIRAADTVIGLPPAQLALLAMFARRAQRREPPLRVPKKGVPDESWAEQYVATRHEISDLDEKERSRLARRIEGEFVSSLLSKLRDRLKTHLGPAVAPYLLDDGGKRPHRYRLALPPEAIHFASLDGATETN